MEILYVIKDKKGQYYNKNGFGKFGSSTRMYNSKGRAEYELKDAYRLCSTDLLKPFNEAQSRYYKLYYNNITRIYSPESDLNKLEQVREEYEQAKRTLDETLGLKVVQIKIEEV